MKKKLKILAAGDLHGDLDVAERLSRKAKRTKADLVVLAGDINDYFESNDKILEPFNKAKQKVVFVPGNIDSFVEHEALRKNARSIHNYYVTYGEVAIAGIGNPDWKMELDEGDLRAIKKNFDMMKPKKRILVSHLHAADTGAEFSGIPGDDILKKAVKQFKPDLLISGHIHEAEGIESKLGKTKVIQVGKKGKILEI